MTDTTRIEIRLPRLGWSMEEGTFVGWLKQPGELVQAGQPLFTLENDKATQEVEAIDSGVLQLPDDPPQSGQTLPVGALLGYLLAGSPATSIPNSSPTNEPGGSEPAQPIPVSVQSAPAVIATTVASTAQVEKVLVDKVLVDKVLASPRARRLATANQVDLVSVTPSGTSGRIAEKDVRAVLSQTQNQVGIQASPAISSASFAQSQSIAPFRRTIAQRMLASQQHTAPVTLVSTIDAGNLVVMRSQLKSQATTEAVPSYTDIIMKQCARALALHPQLAARWQDDQVIPASSLDIGFAVDTEYGLAVPVVRAVDRLSLLEVAARTRQLITAALDRRLQSQDIEGGVFTVTNLGGFGIDAFTPIINYPQCAILGLGAIRREPVILPDGSVGAGWRMTWSLTFDHRIVDGAPAARFLQTLRELVEA